MQINPSTQTVIGIQSLALVSVSVSPKRCTARGVIIESGALAEAVSVILVAEPESAVSEVEGQIGAVKVIREYWHSSQQLWRKEVQPFTPYMALKVSALRRKLTYPP